MIRTVNITGDWHIRLEEEAKQIDRILPKKVPLVLMGDLIDSGLDRGMSWNQDNVDLQVSYLQDILKSRRVLGYVLGNHEDRIMRKVGLNPYRAFLGEQKTDYFFKPSRSSIGAVRQLVIQHGTRCVQNPLSQLQTLADINPNSDIVALGHDHTLGFFRYNNQWIIRTGHMQPYPEYARKAVLKPKPMGYIRYSPRTNKVEVILVETK